MGYSTKKKIADCVKELVRHKEIRKITIQDIMDKTNMSRQTFYYNFKDIYDVLAWIGMHDLACYPESEHPYDINLWFHSIMTTINQDSLFYRRIINEISWPMILDCMRQPMVDTLNQILKDHDAPFLDSEAQFFVNLFCYYLMDYIHNHRAVSENDILMILTNISQQKSVTAFVPSKRTSANILCS